MRSAAQTYKNVARQTSSPRELEATLLLQAAARLQSVHDSWDRIARNSTTRCSTTASSGRSSSAR